MNKSCGEEVSVVAQKLLKPDVSPVRWSWTRGKPALHSAHGQVHRHLNSRMPAPGPPHSFPAPAHTPLQGSLCFRSTNGLQEGWFLPVVIAPGAPLNTQGRGPIPSRDQGTPWEPHRWALPINATFHGPNAPGEQSEPGPAGGGSHSSPTGLCVEPWGWAAQPSSRFAIRFPICLLF